MAIYLCGRALSALGKTREDLDELLPLLHRKKDMRQAMVHMQVLDEVSDNLADCIVFKRGGYKIKATWARRETEVVDSFVNERLQHIAGKQAKREAKELERQARMATRPMKAKKFKPTKAM